MTGKAIDLLSKNSAGKKKGFFLQVESASIDKKDHAADACGQIGETQQMDEAVSKALDFARKDGNTLVIVTADHAHTSQIVDGNTPGLTAKLTTKDGSDMIVAYGTSAGRGQPAAHGFPGAGRRLRTGRGQRGRADRPDRPVLHHAERAGHRTALDSRVAVLPVRNCHFPHVATWGKWRFHWGPSETVAAVRNTRPNFPYETALPVLCKAREVTVSHGTVGNRAATYSRRTTTAPVFVATPIRPGLTTTS